MFSARSFAKGIPMKTLWTALAVVLLAGPLAPARGETAPPAPAGVDWLGDYSLALEEALLTRRPVLLTFYTTWCGWCRKLEATTFKDEGFSAMVQHVVPVRVDGDQERGLVGLFQIRSYPTTVVIDRRGREIGRLIGYYPPAEFVRHIQNALDRREPLEEVSEAALARPEDPEAIYALADVLLALGRYEESRTGFERVLGLLEGTGSPLIAETRLDIALTYLFNYDFRTAEPMLARYLAAYPGSGRRDEALFFHGLALLRTGRRAEGLKQIDAAVAITGFTYLRFEAKRLKAMLEEEERS